MHRVNSVDEYQELLSEIKSRKRIVYSNTLFIKSVLDKYIEEKSLYYLITEDGILLLRKDNKRTLLYYQVEKIKSIPMEKLPEDTVVEIIDKRSLNRMYKHEDALIQVGFKKYSINEEMIIKPEEEILQSDLPHGIRLVLGDSRHSEGLMRLWQENLDPISMPFPTVKEMDRLMRESEIAVLIDEEDQVIGGLQSDSMNGKTMLSHIVISRKHRGKGLGYKMIAGFMKEIGADSFTLWVKTDNNRAKKVYRKMGFQETDKIATQYVI